MGAGGSKPPPPPRVSKKLAGTTVQLQHLPPLITAPARDGIQRAAEAKYLYLSSDVSPEIDHLLATTHEHLAALIVAAHKGANFRDYLALLIEKAILSLSTKTGRPSTPLAEIACLVNPFLNREREHAALPVADGDATIDALRFAPNFRPSDLEHVADEEKDLLVLLYYCYDLSRCANEAIDFVARISEKMGTPSILETRKESFSETDVYVQWAAFYIVVYLGSKPPGLTLPDAAASKLQVETGSNLERLLTVCNMLLKEHRLDQICFLLQFLDIAPHPTARAWYRRRVAALARGMKKKRNSDRNLKDGHVAVADRLLRDVKTARDTAKDRWGWKAGVKVSVGDSEYELHKMKKD